MTRGAPEPVWGCAAWSGGRGPSRRGQWRAAKRRKRVAGGVSRRDRWVPPYPQPRRGRKSGRGGLHGRDGQEIRRSLSTKSTSSISSTGLRGVPGGSCPGVVASWARAGPGARPYAKSRAPLRGSLGYLWVPGTHKCNHDHYLWVPGTHKYFSSPCSAWGRNSWTLCVPKRAGRVRRRRMVRADCTGGRGHPARALL